MKISGQFNQIFKVTGVLSLAFGLVACQQLSSQAGDAIPSNAFSPDGAQSCVVIFPPIIHDLDPFDGDGNGVNDLAVFRPPTISEPGHWYWRNERDPYLGEFSLEKLGVKGDWLVPNDYDGPDANDRTKNGQGRSKSDIAIYRPPAPETRNPGEWWIAYSNNPPPRTAAYSSFKVIRWGINDSLAQPVPADYDGDGVADLAVWQPSTGLWKIRQSLCNQDLEFNLGGNPGDQPLAFDFNGDGRADPTIFNSFDQNHPAHWRILESNPDHHYRIRDVDFGAPKSEPYPANYDGDEKVDIAVYSLTDSLWHIKPSEESREPYTVGFGYNSDIRIPGYYNDDNYADFAVFRPSERLPHGEERIGYWYVLDGYKYLNNQTSDMIIAGPFGLDQDIPLKVYQIK
jgi:hypothetical protein